LFEPNIPRILSLIGPSDIVLDIGGWACPFNRANFVMDAEPYETRGYYKTFGQVASQGGEKEYFTKDSWFCRDICNHEPYPFADKSIDFVTCSHVLEDIRDPLWVCSEMIRIAKRGYIEVPSRLVETCRGWETERTAGLSHHRWLISIDERRNQIEFLMKYHMIHSDRRHSFPPAFMRRLTPEQQIVSLFWTDQFSYSERTIHGTDRIASELRTYVSERYRYPKWQLALDRLGAFARRVRQAIERRLPGRSR
jgi:Methyltransferase domain